jgi:hypothetical protein
MTEVVDIFFQNHFHDQSPNRRRGCSGESELSP